MLATFLLVSALVLPTPATRAQELLPPDFAAPLLPATVPCDSDVAPAPKNPNGCVSFPEGRFDKPAALLPQKMSVDDAITYMRPLALYMQELAGYPASVFLAQFIEETGHGTSPLFRAGSNVAGLSGFAEDGCPIRNQPYRLTGFPKGDGKPFPIPDFVPSHCDRPRSSSGRHEKGYYRTFDTVQDATLAVIWNVTTNPKKPYSEIRSVLKMKDLDLKRSKVIHGLRAYAESPAYRESLKAHIKKLGLEKYDRQRLCK